MLRTLLSLTVLTLAACGGDGPSAPPVPVEVLVTPSQDTLTVTGASVRFSAQVLGENGNVLTGIPVTWTSNRPTVAEIDSTGLATAVAPGVAHIRAVASGVVGQVPLTVALRPVHTEMVAGEGQTGFVGSLLGESLQVQVTDGAGFPIPLVRVDFAVLQGGGGVFPGSPVTGPDGIATTGWTLGPDPNEPQRVQASVEELSTEFHATALWHSLRVITTSPHSGWLTVEYAGQLEAWGGTGVSYTWSVLDGILPSGVTLSPQGELTGTPTEGGSFIFTVRVEDSEEMVASRQLTLRVCPAPTQLGPGEAEVLEPTVPDGCGFYIPAGDSGDRYRVGIVRSETNRNSADVAEVTLEVRGVGVQPTPAPLRIPSSYPSSLGEADPIATSTEAFHLKLREEERRFLATLPADFRPLPSRPSQTGAVVTDQAQGAPERRLLNFPSDGCSAVTPTIAFLIGESEHIAVYQDSVQHITEPLDSAAVQAMLDYYRDYGRSVIEGYFGGVSDVNGDGRVVVFSAPGIREGVAGFVRSSDMTSQEYCAASNEMEITYLRASFINGYVAGRYQLVGTLVHEIKHISSLYNRLMGGSFHPSWVEEGTAEIASDRASRLAMSETGGPAMGAMLTLLDIEEFGTALEGYNTLLRLSRSMRYIASQPNSVTVNPDGAEFMSASGPQQLHTIYGAGWHFHRWLGDAYGGAATPFADSALFRLQNDSLTTAGPAGYPELVGKTFSELMEEYAVAVMLNGTEAPAPPRAFTSVDFPSAMSSTSVHHTASRPLGSYPWPVTPTGGEIASVSLESATYSGPMGESGLRVHDFTSNGTGQGAEITVSAPSMARVIVVRLR